jgi:ATP-dependent DNA helicase RecQ
MKDHFDILRTVFGYAAYRGEQQQIVERVIGGGDALVLMPTGGGKSLCFQIPALVRNGIGVVISPLIALMQDQVAALRQLEVRAAMLNSSLSFDAMRAVERQIAAGELDLLYVAPERLLQPRTLELLDGARIALFAIDEAHCVSQWGHDFRPEYLGLGMLAERYAAVPRIALTATADETTRRDIATRLKLDGAPTFLASFDRPNITYSVVVKDNPREQLRRFLERAHAEDAGIVYCMTRKRVDDTADWLARKLGRTVLPYHAGLDARTREANQERFLREEGVVMVATIAFGMGIDKPNVRFVAHLDLPKSVEAYYQETGRAGRDGLPANAWMAYGLNDVGQLRQLMATSGADERQKRIERHKLEAILGYCETTRCRRQVLLGYFGETLAQPCGNCDTCQSPVRGYDGTIAAQKALSAIVRTGARFGVAHLTDVLLGEATEKVMGFHHDQLKTFGVGADLSRREWASVFRQLVAAGHAEVDVEGHGGLSLGATGRAVLKGEIVVELREDPAATVEPRMRRRDRAGPSVPLDADPALFQALRAWRLEVARAQGVPPYVVFHDSTLAEIAARRPESLEVLAGISGIGERKLVRYGSAVLEVVRSLQ